MQQILRLRPLALSICFSLLILPFDINASSLSLGKRNGLKVLMTTLMIGAIRCSAGYEKEMSGVAEENIGVTPLHSKSVQSNEVDSFLAEKQEVDDHQTEIYTEPDDFMATLLGKIDEEKIEAFKGHHTILYDQDWILIPKDIVYDPSMIEVPGDQKPEDKSTSLSPQNNPSGERKKFDIISKIPYLLQAHEQVVVVYTDSNGLNRLVLAIILMPVGFIICCCCERKGKCVESNECYRSCVVGGNVAMVGIGIISEGIGEMACCLCCAECCKIITCAYLVCCCNIRCCGWCRTDGPDPNNRTKGGGNQRKKRPFLDIKVEEYGIEKVYRGLLDDVIDSYENDKVGLPKMTICEYLCCQGHYQKNCIDYLCCRKKQRGSSRQGATMKIEMGKGRTMGV